MRILMGAQSCGFGPVSKLVAISRLLSGNERIAAVDTLAYAFARQNADAFDTIYNLDGGHHGALDRLLVDVDVAVSVMDADLVFRAVTADCPVVMIDSLLSFWQLRMPAQDIAELCRIAPRYSYAAIDAHLAPLSPHERIFAAHLLSNHSIAQNFPEVPDRLSLLRNLGHGETHLTGAIIDSRAIAEVPNDDSIGRPDLLINLGGFQNFLLDFDSNNAYLHLMRRWVEDLLLDWSQFRRVVVCSGAFGGPRELDIVVGGRIAEFRFLRQREFLCDVSKAPYYMLTPGLTAIHEALAFGRLPMALPEQHYGHIFNMRALRGTLFDQLGTRFAETIDPYVIPADDFVGTKAIVSAIERLLEKPSLYSRFRRMMNEHIEAYIGLTADERAHGASELRRVFAGPSLHTVMADVFDPSRARLNGVHV